MSKQYLIDQIRPLVAFEWHERDGNHYCVAEHRTAYEGLGEAEIQEGVLGKYVTVTHPFKELMIATESVDKAKARAENAIIKQLATCAQVGYLFADKVIEQNNL